MKWIKRIKLDFEYNDKFYEADVEVEMYLEKNWGADADGNRGIDKQFIEDIEIVELRNEEGKTIDEITDEIFDLVEGLVIDRDLSRDLSDDYDG